MADKPVFNVGDVVIETPTYVGMINSPQEYIIIATYRNEYGFWHAAETSGVDGRKIHVPLIDGTAAFSLVRKAAVEPPERPKRPHPHEALLKDMESLRSDWEKVLGPIVKWWIEQR